MPAPSQIPRPGVGPFVITPRQFGCAEPIPDLKRWHLQASTASGSTIFRNLPISSLFLGHLKESTGVGTCFPCSSRRFFQIVSAPRKGNHLRTSHTLSQIDWKVCFCWHIHSRPHFFCSFLIDITLDGSLEQTVTGTNCVAPQSMHISIIMVLHLDAYLHITHAQVVIKG